MNPSSSTIVIIVTIDELDGFIAKKKKKL